MSLLTSVLVRGINNLSDARYCAGMGADRLTFQLDPALPGHLTPEAVQEISGWIAGVDLVGEFDTMPAAAINDLAQRCKLQGILLHRRRTPAELAKLTLPVFKLMGWIPDMLPEDVDTRFRDQQAHVAGFVLAQAPVQQLTPKQLTHLTQQARSFPIWLSDGFAASTKGSVRELVETVRPTGIVLEGGNEIKPGLRDFSEMEAVFEALED
jgi:phosphoribosylanthranilate isomerase